MQMLQQETHQQMR